MRRKSVKKKVYKNKREKREKRENTKIKENGEKTSHLVEAVVDARGICRRL